jgi:hypothetical protein
MVSTNIFHHKGQNNYISKNKSEYKIYESKNKPEYKKYESKNKPGYKLVKYDPYKKKTIDSGKMKLRK